jgi:hypothetical protein
MGKENSDDGTGGVWPGGARLAVSLSMQFEAGGQPGSGAGGPITEPILPGFLDHPDTAAWVCREPAPVSGLPGRSA